MSAFLNKNNKELVIAGYSNRQKKTLFFNHAEIIENYEEQAKTGKPHFAPRTRTAEELEKLPKGFLIWSLTESCGVCFKFGDNDYRLLTGHQGDFIYL